MTRPRRIRRAAAVLLVAVLVPVPPATAQTADDESARRLRAHALERVNASRAEAGLPALRPSGVLDEAAQAHAEDMLARGFFDHVTPEGRTAFERFVAAGGDRWAASGENIASCSGCAVPPRAARVDEFHAGWMQSPGHRENILSAGFARFGFGIAGEGDEIYAVQTFSGPGESVAGDGETPFVTAPEARAAALEAVNATRGEAGLAPLEASAALDTVANGALDTLTRDGRLPGETFGLLPEGASGWTTLALRGASRGGAGAQVSRGDVAAFVESWASADGELLGGEGASHLGFASRASGDGRNTAVAVFGGRE